MKRVFLMTLLSVLLSVSAQAESVNINGRTVMLEDLYAVKPATTIVRGSGNGNKVEVYSNGAFVQKIAPTREGKKPIDYLTEMYQEMKRIKDEQATQKEILEKIKELNKPKEAEIEEQWLEANPLGTSRNPRKAPRGAYPANGSRRPF